MRISDPCITLSETVIETSGIPCYADTPNRKNRVSPSLTQIKILSSPLERSLTETVEKELIDVHNKNELKSFLENKYDWDVLASSNVWTFGP